MRRTLSVSEASRGRESDARAFALLGATLTAFVVGLSLSFSRDDYRHEPSILPSLICRLFLTLGLGRTVDDDTRRGRGQGGRGRVFNNNKSCERERESANERKRARRHLRYINKSAAVRFLLHDCHRYDLCPLLR